jgi:hypothetical protein
MKERFEQGQRVELVMTDDPYTRLHPGSQGTVLWDDGDQIAMHWDDGSSLTMVRSAGDEVRSVHVRVGRGGD